MYTFTPIVVSPSTENTHAVKKQGLKLKAPRYPGKTGSIVSKSTTLPIKKAAIPNICGKARIKNSVVFFDNFVFIVNSSVFIAQLYKIRRKIFVIFCTENIKIFRQIVV